MNVLKIGGSGSLAGSGVRFQSLSKHLVQTKSEEIVLDKKTLYDHFSHEDEKPYDFNESIIAGFKAAIDKAKGDDKKNLQMRLYWHEYNNIFSGGSVEGWRSLDMNSMYSQAAEIFKQIEDSSDSEETKDLKRQALQNALKTGTGMYSMYRVAEKMQSDAQEAEAQGRAIDRTHRSKAKFNQLNAIIGNLQSITSTFFRNLMMGKGGGIDYGSMITAVVGKMMEYRQPE